MNHFKFSKTSVHYCRLNKVSSFKNAPSHYLQTLKQHADYPVIQRNTIKIVMSRKMFFFPHECPTPEIQADTLVIPSANAKHSTCADINLYQSD